MEEQNGTCTKRRLQLTEEQVAAQRRRQDGFAFVHFSFPFKSLFLLLLSGGGETIKVERVDMERLGNEWN